MTDDRAADLALIERREAIIAVLAADYGDSMADNERRLCALARRGLDAPPREPTDEMAQVGFNEYCTMNSDPRYYPKYIWRAMHDAWTGREHDR